MRSVRRPRAVGGRPGAHINQGFIPELVPSGRIPDKNVVTECTPGCTPAARRPAGSFHRG